MRLIRTIIIFMMIMVAMFYFVEKMDISSEEMIDDIKEKIVGKKSELETKEIPEKRILSNKLTGDLFQWMGKSEEELNSQLGEPTRKDPSAYGYSWIVYTDQQEQYIQFGIEDGEIKSIYATGSNLAIEPFKIGQTYDDIHEDFTFSNRVTYDKGINHYQFRLNEEDLAARPLAKITNNIFIQCYFDTFTNKLSAIRLITGELLLRHRPYEIQYRGELPESPNLSDKEWSEVGKGMEQQIFDITNVLRNYYGLSQLHWDEDVHEVAYLHSKDMSDHNYFSHYGLDGDGLKERLAVKKVHYVTAGENIAAQYPDAPAAVAGWLNSKGHREALLNKEYTHLGVGVYQFYYTQNFLGKPF